MTQFVARNKRKEWDANFLKKFTQLSGYSIAYTGMGYVGFYKLTMEFEKETIFVTKVDPGVYPKPVAAAIVDHALDYFFLKVQQDEVTFLQQEQ